MLAFMAAILFGAFAFVSCGDDDEDPAPEPTPVVENYAKYIGMFSEEIFDYYNISVTFEYDDQAMTYTYDENTKVKALEVDKMPGLSEVANKAGRVLQVPAFKYAVHPVKCTHKFELTEAGKQKMANDPTREIFFGFHIDFNDCDKNGIPAFSNGTIDSDGFGGVYVSSLEEFIANQIITGRFTKILK